MRRAFTLIELLVVLGIAALLLALLMPALGLARQEARSVVCLSNLRQLATAAQQYAAQNKGTFPASHYYIAQAGHTWTCDWDYTYLDGQPTGAGLLFPGDVWPRVQACP